VRSIRIEEERSGLSVTADLLHEAAPANTAFLWELLATPREIAAIHAMWTGPEISAPVPEAMLTEAQRRTPLPLENATIMPQAGEIVLAYLPPRVWGGGAAPVFDIGIFYGPNGRMFFPIGWHAGSVVGRVPAAQVPALAEACGRIRRNGVCTLRVTRVEGRG
jgi:hypothetical protein